MQVVSPDGRTRIILGDDQFAMAVIPSAALASVGYRDGSMLPNGTGYTPIRAFVPAVQFAEQYARTHVGCPDFL
jgi:hypothetical protein